MRHLLYLLFAASILSCNTTQKEVTEFFPADNDEFLYSGRYSDSENGVELINSAASVKTTVFGDSVSIAVVSGNDQHQYISIEIGEEYKGRFRIKSDTLKFALPEANQGTMLTIYKDTEASNGSVLFKGLAAEKIESVEREERPAIEFIGNSITCGMGADTREIACEDGEWYDQHNAYLAYGSRVARALNVDYVLNCVSGMGMYRNWNDEDMPVMADVYSSMRLDGNGEEMVDSSSKAPDIVSIALGTNDLSLGDGSKERTAFDQEVFVQRYISFLEMIFSKYPETKIALISSPMIGKNENDLLITSLKRVKEHFETKDISVFEFEKMEAGGCTSHPDIEDHRKMAEQLVPFFRGLLN